MNFRLAVTYDLPQLKIVFEQIVAEMNNENGQIWDEIYPCEFFANDIKNNRLYVLEENDEIISAFALWDADDAASHVKWENERAKVTYFGRFGVNVGYQRKGIGKIMLDKAISIAKSEGSEYLRLFVVDKNLPAINFYAKNGFKKASGYYDEIFDDGFAIREFGFEIEIQQYV